MNDPQAATLDAPATTAGTFVWHELNTPDPAASRAFYTDLFGWDVNVADLGDLGMYTTFVQDEAAVAGLTKAPDDPDAAANWIGYATVPELFCEAPVF